MVQRNLAIDSLKIILAMLVVAIHVIGNSPSLIGHMLANGIFRVAVPVFFVINGFYLFGAVGNTDKFLGWVGRILFLYIFWMLVYSPFYLPFGQGLTPIAISLLKKLIVSYFHLWYVLGMLWGGVLLFFLRNGNNQTIVLIAVILYLSGALVQYFQYYYQPVGFPIWSARNFLFFAFPMMA